MSDEFINYLKYIGFFKDNDAYNLFFQIYSKNANNNINGNKISFNNKKSIIISSMLQYINSLSSSQLESLLKNIYEKYIENRLKIESNKLIKILKIYHNKEIKFYFVYWKKLSKYLCHEELFNNNLSKYNKKSLNNSVVSTNNDFIKRQELFMQKKKFNMMKNIDDNEQEIQLLYTFKPNINDKNLFNIKIEQKQRRKNLYKNKSINGEKMKNLIKIVDNERGYTFKPKTNIKFDLEYKRKSSCLTLPVKKKFNNI